jgi:hypothetical protein
MKNQAFTYLGWNDNRVALVTFYTDDEHRIEDDRAAFAELGKRLNNFREWRRFDGTPIVSKAKLRRRGNRCTTCRALNSRPGRCRKCTKADELKRKAVKP